MVWTICRIIILLSVYTHMGYEIYIQRPLHTDPKLAADGERIPITLQEWQNAVRATPGVRLADGPWPVTDDSGQVIRFEPNYGGDVEVFEPAENKWIRAFWWSSANNIIHLSGDLFLDDEFAPVYKAAIALTKHLGGGARLVGDNGETYD
jgi:hypothetical protein